MSSGRLFPTLLLLAACAGSSSPEKGSGKKKAETGPFPASKPEPTLVLSEDEWRKRLTPEQFRILREHDTEYAGTGKLLKNKKKGVYKCAGCGTELFLSKTKFDSGTGWPSFYAPVSTGSISYISDRKWGMTRTEVRCPVCDGHLGHVFEDGPPPTGHRYCINSAALTFQSTQ